MLPTILAAFLHFFRKVPGFAPVASVRPKFHWRIGGGDLVLGCGEGGAFGGVLALAAYRTVVDIVHRKPSGNSHHGLSECS